MSEEQKQGSAGQAGSPINNTVPNPNDFGGLGETAEQKPNHNDETNNTSGTVSEEQYKNLERKLGEQGTELGTLRDKNKEFETFFEEISPLMERLEADKDLISLIVEGKINSGLVKDVLEGRVSKVEAEAVTEANKEVKKEMGTQEYKDAKPEDIEQRILEKVGNLLDEKFNKTQASVSKQLTESEKLREYEKVTEDFARNTADFHEYHERIAELMNENPSITDIKVLYRLAKGEALEKQKEEADKNSEAENAKNMALNASGGGSLNTAIIKDNNLVDDLIGGSTNPNSF